MSALMASISSALLNWYLSPRKMAALPSRVAKAESGLRRDVYSDIVVWRLAVVCIGSGCIDGDFFLPLRDDLCCGILNWNAG